MMLFLNIVVVVLATSISLSCAQTCTPLTAGNSKLVSDLVPLLTQFLKPTTPITVADIDAKLQGVTKFIDFPPSMDKCIGSIPLDLGELAGALAPCLGLATHPVLADLTKLAADFTTATKDQPTLMGKIPYALNFVRSVEDAKFAKVCGLVVADVQQCIIGNVVPLVEKILGQNKCCTEMVKESQDNFSLKPSAVVEQVFEQVVHVACDTQEKYPVAGKAVAGQQTCLFTAVQSFVPGFDTKKKVSVSDMLLKLFPLADLAQIQNAGGCDAFNGEKYLKVKTAKKVSALKFVDKKVYSGCSTTTDNVMTWIRNLPIVQKGMIGNSTVAILDLFADGKYVSATQFLPMLKKIVPKEYHSYLGAIGIFNLHFTNGFAAKCDFVLKHTVTKFVNQATDEPGKTDTPSSATTAPPTSTPAPTGSAAISGLSTAALIVSALAYFH